MPLTAVLDGQPIFIFDHDARELANIASLVKRRRQSLRCKDCTHAMTVVMPGRRSWHFRHLPGASVDCHYVIARESEAHLELKRRIYDMCRARGWDAEVEWHVPGTSRRADVWARDYLGRQFTFEVQLSAIPDATAYDRSSDHLRAGFTPVWLVEGDLRSWAFPDGAKRARLQWHDDWMLIGIGDPVGTDEIVMPTDGDLFTYARIAKSLALTKLLPLLDAPAPLPSRPIGASRSGQTSPFRDRTPLALPAGAQPVLPPADDAPQGAAADEIVQSQPVAGVQRLRVPQRPSASKRYRRNPDLPDHVVVIDRLQSLASVLTDAPTSYRDRFERIRDLPRRAWTQEHLLAALELVWRHRIWLWEQGWQSGCGRCGLPLDPDFVRRGYHFGCE